jgi:DNA-binding MurR/RpiR family transcriptional regulator
VIEPKSVGARIRMLLPTLTALEARVISVLLNPETFDDKTLLKWVANEARVSEGLVVKLARKLGFSGFRSLRAALAEHNRLPVAEVHEELTANDSPSGIIEKVFRASIKALQQTLEVISTRRSKILLHTFTRHAIAISTESVDPPKLRATPLTSFCASASEHRFLTIAI